VPQFCAHCDTVFVTEGFCSEEKKEEASVAWKLVQGELKRVWGGTLYLPNELGGFDPDNIPLGHNQFRSTCRSKGRIREPIPEPSRLPPLPQLETTAGLSKALTFLPTLQDLGYSAEETEAAYVDDPRGAMVWEGGEEAAWIRLQKWMFDDDRLKDYRDTQNGMLGEKYSSKLSPWIARGCISVRRIRSEVRRYEAERAQNHGTYWFHNLLEWRDRMIYIARSQGDGIFKLGGIAGDQYSWPWPGTQKDLQAWKDGRTGEELVDAAMKELLLTGHMSMRARHIVASFLIYELGVDWRHGAAHFEEHLLDYDPALNWVMWMLQIGVMGPKSGRSLGLSHFDAKRTYASQRKTLANYAPDRAYIRHWQTACRSSHQRGLRQPFPSGQQTESTRGGGYVSMPSQADKYEDQKKNAKHQAPIEQFNQPRLVQL
jgi:deoxyribodipyrimidine photo-lyase